MSKIKTLWVALVAVLSVALVGTQSALATGVTANDPVDAAQTAIGDASTTLANLVVYGIAGVVAVALAWAAMRIAPKIIKRFT